ncbi:MAG: VCBS repeat-containing protein, partial [Rhodanobacteraceae bacterium]
MRARSRLIIALATIASLSGFTFVRHHITEAPVVDDTIPFYGSGLMIGPAETLPGVIKRAPFKFRAYKFIQHRGDTQYVPGLRREADCSLSEVWTDLADYTIAQTDAAFGDRLRRAAGLVGPAGPYAGGCSESALGTASRVLAGGRLANGGYFGAGPDFHSDGSAVLYRSDGATVVDHHDVVLGTTPNQYVGDLSVADFNGDGHGDYAIEIGAYGADSVARIAFLAGDGAGNFGAPTYATVATAPAGSNASTSVVGMTIADFNHDARLDVAAAVSIGGSTRRIVLLAGHGDGTFEPAATIAEDVGGDLVAADFNGDDELDLASGDGRVLFGDGAGGFALAPGERFDDGALAAADFDRDGHIDLAAEAYTGDGSLIRIWRGDGSGGFTRVGPSYGTGYGAGSADLVATDLDGDGKPDLVVGSAGDGLYGPSINTQGQTQFLLGRGDGTFASPPAYEKAVQTVADFDRDGKPDLLSVDAVDGAGGVRVLEGDGHGHFSPGAFTALGFGSSGSQAPFVAADFDGDDKIDLVALEHRDTNSAYVHTRLGNGDATFHTSGPDLQVAFDVQTTSAGLAAQPAVADFDGDGKLDLAIVGLPGAHGALYLLKGNGDGSFAAPMTIDATLTFSGYAATRVVASDLDGDGKPDLVLEDGGAPFDATPVPGGLRVYRNLGGGTFAAALALNGPDEPDGIDVGDVDRDGKPDIVATGNSNVLYVYAGNGDATFGAAVTTTLPDIWFRSVLISDIDGDGKADLVLGNCCGLTFGWYARGDGTGSFETPRILPLIVSPTALLLADLDGNGR